MNGRSLFALRCCAVVCALSGTGSLCSPTFLLCTAASSPLIASTPALPCRSCCGRAAWWTRSGRGASRIPSRPHSSRDCRRHTTPHWMPRSRTTSQKREGECSGRSSSFSCARNICKPERERERALSPAVTLAASRLPACNCFPLPSRSTVFGLFGLNVNTHDERVY